jgi:hypothetical protein
VTPHVLGKLKRMIVLAASVALTLWLATNSAAQQPATENAQAAAPPSAGVISGRVVDSSGQPLTSAIAYATAIGSRVPPRGAVMDTDGAFKLEGLETGVYAVWANAPGFVTESPFAAPDAPRKYYRPGDSVTISLVRGGVIAGTVTTVTGQPVVAVVVRALRVRDVEGQPVEGVSQPRERQTDDRGIYRIYGLQPGTYVVSAGGPGQFYSGIPGPYDVDAATYAPSSTRDTALEIGVRSGEEAMGVNIQYRGEPGHAISGAVTGILQNQGAGSTGFFGSSVTLTDVQSRTTLMYASASSYNGYSFEFYGVPDGEYQLDAQRSVPNGEATAAEPRRIRVKGADVTGIALALVPLSSILGQVIVESHPELNCAKRRATALRETLVTARRDPKAETKSAENQKEKIGVSPENKPPINLSNTSAEALPGEKGEFTLRGLRSGSYRVESHLPGIGWFVRSIMIGAPPPNATATKRPDSNIPRDGIILKSGERVSGLTVTIAEGAASFRGRVMVAEGQSLPPNLRVYLVPAEKEGVADVLRFFETRADTDGGFAMSNIAPGHYWMIGRVADGGEPATVKSIRQDSALRSQVVKEAEKTRNEIELQPCQRIVDYEIRYPPANDAKPKP